MKTIESVPELKKGIVGLWYRRKISLKILTRVDVYGVANNGHLSNIV